MSKVDWGEVELARGALRALAVAGVRWPGREDIRDILEENTMNERLLTVEEAAEHYRVAISTVRKWCADGSLAAVRRGRAWRIPASALVPATAVVEEDGLREAVVTHLRFLAELSPVWTQAVREVAESVGRD